ncbi:unnamed protein product [Hymenolepis diminuta]|uniref:Uncharacterized protein n=1 Tax=Hymenolepis diminuta TaxID=6216 RepID=A0A564YR76_HYMDI|nr:unnamed protein product [Hymenolepis diminuta]
MRPRSWNDIIYIPMTHNPCLTCLNASIDFPLSITASLHIKGTSALMLWRDLTQVTHKAILVFRWSVTGYYTSCSSPLSISLPLLLVSNSLWLP